ncbi:MAG: DUF3078 domain-containing protein [Prolixibacteraceae bacterium]|nr:DUF3078 domain-containing protein [Prolixibacteraceae bacterium]
MLFKKLLAGFMILISVSLFAETAPIDRKKEKLTPPADSIQLGIDYLKKHIRPDGIWQSENPEILKTINGLIHFAEDPRIDSVLVKLEKFQKQEGFKYINRSPLLVSDSLQIKGYNNHSAILEKMKQLDRAIWTGVDFKAIPLHENLTAGPDGKVPSIDPGDEEAILRRTRINLPDSLKNVHAIPDSLAKTTNDFSRIKRRQEVRSHLLENARQQFNQKIARMNLDSAITAYRSYAVRVFSDSLQKQLRDSLKIQNEKVLTNYNDSIVRSVNDSINRFVKTLQRYAQNDSISVQIQSLSGKPVQVWLRNNQRTTSRLYIKNEQNDSLAIRMMNLDKYSLGIAIDDDVTFDRIAQKQRRDFVFEKINPDQKLNKIQKRYTVVTPWSIGGTGNFGLTQTYLNNWKAGGRSAFSFLTVLKGYANYSNAKLKWENSGELRNGWIRQGGDVDQTQKNDDKLELISRLGVSAFKKWYYSSEIDFVTQFFNGYNYPDKTKLISSYLSPAKTLIKLGLDYKPNKNFSLFLSPITAKNVFVRDTARIDQTKYGVAANSRSFWEPGLNADLRFKKDFTPQITYETKYKMFVNYQQPFKKLDISWENTVVAQLTDRINMTMMLHLLYDDNVTFDTGKKDANGKAIYKAKWQTKELMTVGFSYKINRLVYRQKKVN